MLKQPIYYEFNLDARTSPSKLIAISHVDDKYSEVLEVAVKQNDRFVYMGGATVVARMVLHREKDYLLSDNVPCTVNANGNILIPFDNAVVKTSQGVVKIEVNITRDTDELTLQFPLWVSVNGSILDNAEVTPESRGTVPDLLREAAEQLSRVKDFATEDFVFENLDAALQGNPHTAPSLFVMQDAETDNYKLVYMDSADDLHVLFDFGLLPVAKGEKGDKGDAGADGYSPTVSTTNLDAQTLVTVTDKNGAHNFYVKDGSSVTNAAVDGNGDLIISIQQKPTSSVHPTIHTLEVNAGHVVGAAGAKGDKGDKGDPGNDYVLTEQDKADIAGMVDISGKADKATTLAGYGITDAYTKTQTDTFFSDTNADIADLKAYIGYTDGDILGLHADFENGVFSRLGAAVGLTTGQDFNAFPMYGGRRRCCVSNDGTINAYYGEQDYVEDGSNGQVMVYQPKFYYCMVPLKLEKQASGLGYHIRKANYYVTANPRPGFKLHPLFYDANGDELDYVLLSAYEGSMYDVSESAYVNDNVDSTTYASGDLLCSVSGKKPISGKLTGIGTKANLEAMAQNRGTGWHLDTIRSVAANQLLMMIEFGKLDFQACIGMGVVNKTTGESTENNSEMTGQSQPNTETGTTAYSAESAPISYRWLENPWGNIWKHVQGINDWGNGSMRGGQLYICSDFDFSESKHTDNYKQSGFALYNGAGYISGFGYGAEEFDWLMIASDKGGSDTLPVGDFSWSPSDINGYKIMCYGGMWLEGNSSPLPKRFGGFCTDYTRNNGFSRNYIGGRLLYVPTATGFGPQGPAGSNYVLTAADRQAIAQIAMNGLNGNGVAY